MDKKRLNNLPVLRGREIPVLAQISERKDAGLQPFWHNKIASGCRRWGSGNHQYLMVTELMKYDGLGQ